MAHIVDKIDVAAKINDKIMQVENIRRKNSHKRKKILHTKCSWAGFYLESSGKIKKHILYKTQEESTMAHTIESLQTRIHMLQQRDPIANQRIIKKLKRQIRAMEKK